MKKFLGFLFCVVFASIACAQTPVKQAEKSMPTVITKPVFVNDVDDCVRKTRRIKGEKHGLSQDACNQLIAKNGIYLVYVISKEHTGWVQVDTD